MSLTAVQQTLVSSSSSSSIAAPANHPAINHVLIVDCSGSMRRDSIHPGADQGSNPVSCVPGGHIHSDLVQRDRGIRGCF